MAKLCTLIVATWLLLVEGFLPVSYGPSRGTQLSKFLARRQHSEYAVLGGDDEEDEAEISDSRPAPFVAEEETTIPSFSSPEARHVVALRRGSVVKIIVGSNSRKAWKKRRRSGSPLLVACSIQGIDELSAIRCNVLSLLRNSRVNTNLLASQYRKAFGEALSHSSFEDRVELLKQLFKNPKYKVNIIEKNQMWYLESYRHKSEETPLLEFNPEYRHTGVLADGESVSAALRVSSTEAIPEPGTELFAVVWDFEPEGDAGFPLVILSLTPPQNNNNDRSRASVKKHMVALNTGYRLRGVATKTLKWGVLVQCVPSRMNKEPILGLLLYRDARLPADSDDDSLDGKDEEDEYNRHGSISELFEMKDDGDLGEEIEDDESDNDEEDMSALFEDLDGEDEDDITDMFQQNEDGSLSYTNPETGAVEIIEMLDDDEEEEVHDDSSVVATDDSSESNETVRSAAKEQQAPSMPRYRRVRVNVGDQVDVFVKSHSPNQRKLYLTMDPTFKSLPKKKRRHLDAVSKRTERLAKRLGGFKKLLKLRGTECEGIVKATSNMGDRRLYIQPNEDLPVGVATCLHDELLDDLQQGDSVRVRLDGLDEQRGQLAMCVLERLDRSPQKKQTSSLNP